MECVERGGRNRHVLNSAGNLAHLDAAVGSLRALTKISSSNPVAHRLGNDLNIGKRVKADIGLKTLDIVWVGLKGHHAAPGPTQSTAVTV